MNIFRFLLVIMSIGIICFTIIAGLNQGWDLLSVFLHDIVSMTWNGQFDFDFMCYLCLSGLWLAWRHHFSGVGILIGLIGAIMGIMLLAPYLLIASYQANGDVKILLLGKIRASS